MNQTTSAMSIVLISLIPTVERFVVASISASRVKTTITAIVAAAVGVFTDKACF
jgi:hypothetical protein